MILPVQIASFNSPNYQNKPSFQAIHLARYIVRAQDGKLYQVLDDEMIRDMQYIIVKWLNKDANDAKMKMKKSFYVPKEIKDPKMKALKERIVAFFKRNDKDYERRNEVRSFYTTNTYGDTVPYIISGHTDWIDTAAKPIGRVKRQIAEEAETISKAYDIPIEDAKKQTMELHKRELDKAKDYYYSTVEYNIANILSKNNSSLPRNSQFDAYFDVSRKGKKTIYTLFDAKFDGK